MGFGFNVEVWGEYALFTRPETKVERVSYDVMTPSAARGIIEAIYWKPAIRYVIDGIHVLHPVGFTNIRRNEVSSKILASKVSQVMKVGKGELSIDRSADIAQRASMVLTDVRYVIRAHFIMTEKAGPEDKPDKHYPIIMRRLREGQCFHQPCFGCREFPAKFKLFEGEVAPSDDPEMTRDLGLMLYEMDYSNPRDITPMFFRAKLDRGYMNLANCEVMR